jgi:hypothetical protein
MVVKVETVSSTSLFKWGVVSALSRGVSKPAPLRRETGRLIQRSVQRMTIDSPSVSRAPNNRVSNSHDAIDRGLVQRTKLSQLAA